MLLNAINQILTHDEPARARLAQFSGRRLRVETPPLSFEAEVNERGFLIAISNPSNAVPAAQTVSPDLKINFPLSAAPLALLGKERLTREVHVEGNVAFANAMSGVLEHLPLAVEAETERWVGPVVAHRISEAGKGVAAMMKRVGESLERNGTRALTQTRGPLPEKSVAAQWGEEVNQIAKRIDALALRVAQLDRQKNG